MSFLATPKTVPLAPCCGALALELQQILDISIQILVAYNDCLIHMTKLVVNC